jgi:predicted SAM-dependent methyltransferase
MKKPLLKSIVEEFSWGRPIGTYNKVQLIYSRMIRGRTSQMKKVQKLNLSYLNIGCGESEHKDFINLDYQWRPNVHICWDITRGLPFDSGSIKGIFIEHCLEHISFSQCQSVLKELYRILKPNGTVRIIAPDAELYFDLYQKERNGETVSFPYVGEEDIRKGFTPMMAVNRIFRNHGHQYAYDARTFEMLLRNAGFGSIRRVAFMEGTDKTLLVDSEFRRIESLYIEATKTADGGA